MLDDRGEGLLPRLLASEVPATALVLKIEADPNRDLLAANGAVVQAVPASAASLVAAAKGHVLAGSETYGADGVRLCCSAGFRRANGGRRGL